MDGCLERYTGELVARCHLFRYLIDTHICMSLKFVDGKSVVNIANLNFKSELN